MRSKVNRHRHNVDADNVNAQRAAMFISMKANLANKIRGFRSLFEDVLEMHEEGMTWVDIRKELWGSLQEFNVIKKKTSPKAVDAALSAAHKKEIENGAEVAEVVKMIRAKRTLREVLLVAAEDAGSGRGVLRSSSIRSLLISSGILSGKSTPHEREVVGIAISILQQNSLKHYVDRHMKDLDVNE